jgi:hypothetical protein
MVIVHGASNSPSFVAGSRPPVVAPPKVRGKVRGNDAPAPDAVAIEAVTLEAVAA